jgi:hypothetical protein
MMAVCCAMISYVCSMKKCRISGHTITESPYQHYDFASSIDHSRSTWLAGPETRNE